MKRLLSLSCLIIVLVADASRRLAADAPAAAETIRLWPDDAPGALGTSDHDIPVVAWWPAKDAKQPTAAIVVCPGGGYGGLADHEGSDYARWLNSQGISAFVLRYRLGSKGYRHPVMLGDVSRAMRLVRAEYARLGIDPARVGVTGGGQRSTSRDVRRPCESEVVNRAADGVPVRGHPSRGLLPGPPHSGGAPRLRRPA
jgi:acetyl esterase/lipase